MKKLTAIVCCTLFQITITFATAQEMPEFPQPVEQHQWLHRLVGEWDTKVHITPEGMDPMDSEGTATTRPIGGFWIQTDNRGEFVGMPFNGVMTLGFDTEKEKYVGTWVDSMGGYLWQYEGTLDESQRKLTLKTEGPCPNNPGGHSQFEEVLEIKSDDHFIFTSAIQGDDGEWNRMMKVDYRRKQ